MDQRPAAGSFDLARDGIRLGAVAARIHHDGRTALPERERDRAADVAACASDDGDFACKFLGHEPLPAQ
jgi:hypothetical protein